MNAQLNQRWCNPKRKPPVLNTSRSPVRKRISLFLALLLLCLLVSVTLAESWIPEPTLSPGTELYDVVRPDLLSPDQLYALSAILISADTGEVIFEKDADTVRCPASTTLILTVLLAVENVPDLDQLVTVSDYAVIIHAWFELT